MGDLKAAGSKWIGRLGDGIKEKWNGVVKRLTDKISALTDWIKGQLGISASGSAPNGSAAPALPAAEHPSALTPMQHPQVNGAIKVEIPNLPPGSTVTQKMPSGSGIDINVYAGQNMTGGYF